MEEVEETGMGFFDYYLGPACLQNNAGFLVLSADRLALTQTTVFVCIHVFHHQLLR
jgi:hypothetical protein